MNPGKHPPPEPRVSYQRIDQPDGDQNPWGMVEEETSIWGRAVDDGLSK